MESATGDDDGVQTCRRCARPVASPDFAVLEQFHLGRSLGLFQAKTEFSIAKGIFWSDDAVGNLLHEQLRQLADAGILELRKEPDLQFRWPTSSTGERADGP